MPRSRSDSRDPVDARLAQKLGDPEMTLRGSLSSQGRRCGKPGCRCAEGELHGPYTYLSVGRATGTARLLYVPVWWRMGNTVGNGPVTPRRGRTCW